MPPPPKKRNTRKKKVYERPMGSAPFSTAEAFTAEAFTASTALAGGGGSRTSSFGRLSTTVSITFRSVCGGA